MSNLNNENELPDMSILNDKVDPKQVPNLTSLNIPMLHAIIKKLDLSLPQVMLKQRKLKSDKYTSREKAQMLFNLKADEDPEDFLRSRLTEDEIKVLKEAVAGVI